MSKIPPQRIAASCNVFYLVVVNHCGFVCGKGTKKGIREASMEVLTWYVGIGAVRLQDRQPATGN